MLRSSVGPLTVSTTHRAQSTEKSLVVFDPVDACASFYSGADGRRLINVAISRAKAHVIIPYHQNDLRNPALEKIEKQAKAFWNKAGPYARPFSFR